MLAKNYLLDILENVVASKGLLWPDKVNIDFPKDNNFGDMATNLALALAKQDRQSPKQLAEEIKERLEQYLDAKMKIEVAGPGFLNFFFPPEFWQQTIQRISATKGDYGVSNLGEGNKVLVEYVSANPTGPLHIGHGRGAAVGDSLSRILHFTGFDVTTEYYLNDVGRQMYLLGKSIWLRYQQHCGQEISFPQECYQGDYIKQIALQIKEEYGNKFLQEPESRALEFFQEYGHNVILSWIKDDLNNFRAKHQVWFSEKELIENKEVEKTLQKLHDLGLLYEHDEALWFKSSKFGDDKDRVLRKSDGSLTYFATDIAYHANKVSRGFNKLIDVWGADHHGYVFRIKAAIQGLNCSPENLQVLLIQIVNLLRKGEQVTMSTRAGEFVTLADICQEVGVDAARFIFLTRKSDSHLDFDLDLLKQKSMDNPVYYVQYAHARICSVLRKAKERYISLEDLSADILSSLNTEEDIELLKHLDQFPDTIQSAAKTLSPHHISFYLYELAGMLHRYYNKHQVLNASNMQTVQGRLYLILSVAQVIKNGLYLLGVSAPEQM